MKNNMLFSNYTNERVFTLLFFSMHYIKFILLILEFWYLPFVAFQQPFLVSDYKFKSFQNFINASTK